MQRPIWYEPHPVTPERKAELREQGFQILDAVFAPPGHQQEEAAQQATNKRRGRPPKSEAL